MPGSGLFDFPEFPAYDLRLYLAKVTCSGLLTKFQSE